MTIEQEATRDRTSEARSASASAISDRPRGGAAPAPHPGRLGLRDEIPKVGLMEYWYPVIADTDVPARRAARRKVLGQDIAFFRGAKGQVVAITNWCPHRNASMGEGKSLFPGTLSCPYHGLTFDETGNAVAFLGEGPNSKFCSRPGSAARSYPTRTLKGLVFVWMGDGDPAPIEEDVPPEFFDDNAQVLFSEQHWKVNWRASLENLQDAHVYFVHRTSLEVLMQDVNGLNLLLHIGSDRPPTRVVNGRALVFENPRFFDFVDSDQQRKTQTARGDFQDTYPSLGGARFPKTRVRLHLARVFGFLRRHFRPKADWLVTDVEWAQGVHMPTMFRLDYQTHIYTRAVTPQDEENCAIFYYKTMYPRSAARRVWNRINYRIYYDWKQHRNFSGQDKRIVEKINYENPKERLSSSDAFPLAWRRMVVDHARKPQRAAGQSNGATS
jgi:phenylpropionate dioxygenase-like ring-hydroxylating dioxygenase large terminal subunit